MRGGYLIIDLKNKNFTLGKGIVVDGIYDRIKSTRKPLRLCNFVFDGKELRDLEVVFLGETESSYIAVTIVGTIQYILTINDADIVTFAQSEG